MNNETTPVKRSLGRPKLDISTPFLLAVHQAYVRERNNESARKYRAKLRENKKLLPELESKNQKLKREVAEIEEIINTVKERLKQLFPETGGK